MIQLKYIIVSQSRCDIEINTTSSLWSFCDIINIFLYNFEKKKEISIKFLTYKIIEMWKILYNL